MSETKTLDNKQEKLSILRQNYYLEYFLHKTAIKKLGYDSQRYYDEADQHFVSHTVVDSKSDSKSGNQETFFHKYRVGLTRGLSFLGLLGLFFVPATSSVVSLFKKEAHCSPGVDPSLAISQVSPVYDDFLHALQELLTVFTYLLAICGGLFVLLLIFGYLFRVKLCRYLVAKITQKLFALVGIYIQFEEEQVLHVISERKIMSYVLPALRLGYLAEWKEYILRSNDITLIEKKSKQMQEIVNKFDNILTTDQEIAQRDRILKILLGFLGVETLLLFGFLFLKGAGMFVSLSDTTLQIVVGATVAQVTAMLFMVVKKLYDNVEVKIGNKYSHNTLDEVSKVIPTI